MVGGVDQAAWLAWAATVGGAGAPAALDDGRAHASSPSLPDVGRLQWLRFHDAALEEEFVRRFDSRQNMTDLTVSLTNTLVCTVFTLRARRAELPGARLAGFSAVAAAALPMLLLRHSRVAFAAYRRYFFCAYIPLLWFLAARVGILTQSIPRPLRGLSLTSVALQALIYPMWLQLGFRLPIRHHAWAHGLGLAVNLAHNVQRVRHLAAAPDKQLAMEQLAATLRRACPAASLLLRVVGAGSSSEHACLSVMSWFKLTASTGALGIVWLLELRARQAFASRYHPTARMDLRAPAAWHLVWLLPLLPYAAWNAAELLSWWQARLLV